MRTSLGQHNLPKIDSSTQVGIFRDQTDEASQDIAHECHLRFSCKLTTNFERGFKLEENRLLHKYFFCSVTESFDLVLQKVDLFGHFGVADRKQFVNYVVDIEIDFSLHLVRL